MRVLHTISEANRNGYTRHLHHADPDDPSDAEHFNASAFEFRCRAAKLCHSDNQLECSSDILDDRKKPDHTAERGEHWTLT